eukprot:2393117-Pleurochrysis_carterae.AAC.2
MCIRDRDGKGDHAMTSPGVRQRRFYGMAHGWVRGRGRASYLTYPATWPVPQRTSSLAAKSSNVEPANKDGTLELGDLGRHVLWNAADVWRAGRARKAQPQCSFMPSSDAPTAGHIPCVRVGGQSEQVEDRVRA